VACVIQEKSVTTQSNTEIFLSCEQNGDFNDLEYGSLQIWPFIKRHFIMKIDRVNMDKSNIPVNKLHQKKVPKLFFYFSSLKYLIRKYDYFVFTEPNRIRQHNGIYYDRLLSGIFEYIDYKKTLSFYGTTSDENFNTLVNKISTEKIGIKLYEKIFDSIVSLIVKIRRLIFGRLRFEKIDNLLKTLEINNIDYSSNAEKLYAKYLVFKIVFKIYRPKIIFLSNARPCIFRAAYELSIPTVEFQHGVINNSPVYRCQNNLFKSYGPSFFLSFGKTEKDYFDEYHGYVQSQVIPIGNFFLNKAVKTPAKLHIDTSEYDLVFCVSLQHTILKETAELIFKLASLHPTFLFILIPRGELEWINIDDEVKNIILSKKYNCYDVLSISDFHVTGHSSCALETAIFEIPNLFINWHGKSVEFFNDYITKVPSNTLLEPEDVIEFFAKLNKNTKYKIVSDDDYYFVKNYDKEISLFFKEVLHKYN